MGYTNLQDTHIAKFSRLPAAGIIIGAIALSLTSCLSLLQQNGFVHCSNNGACLCY